MPPSLWLSAFMATSTYLTVVISVIVQMTSERAPRTVSMVMVWMPPLSAMMALRVYMGLVPMSPYTTPSATRIIPAERGMPALLARRFFSPSTVVWVVMMLLTLSVLTALSSPTN